MLDRDAKIAFLRGGSAEDQNFRDLIARYQEHTTLLKVDFYDPWGNRLQVVEYGEIQFERTPGVKRKLGIDALDKSESARREIDERGLA